MFLWYPLPSAYSKSFFDDIHAKNFVYFLCGNQNSESLTEECSSVYLKIWHNFPESIFNAVPVVYLRIWKKYHNIRYQKVKFVKPWNRKMKKSFKLLESSSKSCSVIATLQPSQSSFGWEIRSPTSSIFLTYWAFKWPMEQYKVGKLCQTCASLNFSAYFLCYYEQNSTKCF